MARESYPDLIDDLAIIKGETYRKLIENSSILFDGDLTTATLSGQIRNNYVDNAGQLVGTFSFETSTYNQQTNKTLIKPYLTEFATINLPSTPKYSTGRQPSIKTNLVYDIELVHNGRVIKYSPGFVQVIGEVTGGLVSYNPAEEWDAGIASVELTSTVGFTKTYTIWGDEAKTVNLGTFDVIDTQPSEGISGFSPTLPVSQSGTWIVDTELDLSALAQQDTLATIANKIAELMVSDGRLQVDIEGANVTIDTIGVNNFPTTQAISAASLPLPNNAATSTKQDTIIGHLDGLEGLLSNPLAVVGTFYPATQPVSIDVLPALATGSNVIGSISNTEFTVTQSGDWEVTTDLSTLTELLPTSLGVKTSANSLAVTLASDGVASGISTQIGEVQTTPTNNTILGRLKNIVDALVFGQKTKTNSLSITPASDAIFYGSLPTVSSGTILSLTTNATGTTYTEFSSQACTALDLVNNSGTTIEYRRGATGTAMQLPDKSARLILGITNANQIDVRRTDVSNTQVTLQAEAFVL